MKIVINALSARLGGGQTYLKNLLAHLPVNLELEIVIFAPASLQLPLDPRILRGVTRWPTTNPLLRSFWELVALPRTLKAEKADVLFCPGGVVATRVPNGCKVVTMFRNMIPFDADALARIPFGLQKIRNFILKRVLLRSMANADLTIFISDYARRVIEKLILVRRYISIPHGISSAFRTYGQAVNRSDWLPSSEYILYVSRFDVYKHQLEVATAYASLPLDLRRKYKLLLIGEVDELLAQGVINIVKKNNLEGQVFIVGPISYTDLPAAYHHATVNLFASSCENCPNILLEALGAGRPVLSSDVMPMPEFGGDAVGYFSPTDPISIRDEMILVLRDESRKQELVDAAVRRSADFDWEKTSHRTWQAIADLVDV